MSLIANRSGFNETIESLKSIRNNFVSWLAYGMADLLSRSGFKDVEQQYKSILARLAVQDDDYEKLIASKAEEIEEAFRLLQNDDSNEHEKKESKQLCVSEYANVSAYHQIFSRESSDRKLFRTKLGLIGLALDTVQEGDQVWLLTAGHTPFVLRPTSETAKFTLVGDCFMLDLMHGEMLRDHWGVSEQIRPIHII
jgi:hypothetical protein